MSEEKGMRLRNAVRIAGWFVLAMVPVLMPAFAAWGSVSAVGAANIEIGFLLKTMQEDRYEMDKTLFMARAKALGANVVFDSAGNNELTQLHQFEALLDSGVDVIIFQPVNTGTAGSLVRLANNKGVRVVGYDTMLTNGPLDIMVMQDSWAVGKLQGQEMVRWFKEKRGKVQGKVALIMGRAGDSNAKAMSSGVLETIKNNPGLELVAQRSHPDWSPYQARRTVEFLLLKNDNKVDAFVANSAGMARGIIGALRDEGLADANKVFVAGSDADLLNIQYIVQGKQVAAIWKRIKPLACRAAEIAVTLAKNPDRKVTDLVKDFKLINNGYANIPTVVTPVVLVTKDNIDSTVIKGGFFTKEQVYGN